MKKKQGILSKFLDFFILPAIFFWAIFGPFLLPFFHLAYLLSLAIFVLTLISPEQLQKLVGNINMTTVQSLAVSYILLDLIVHILLFGIKGGLKEIFKRFYLYFLNLLALILIFGALWLILKIFLKRT